MSPFLSAGWRGSHPTVLLFFFNTPWSNFSFCEQMLLPVAPSFITKKSGKSSRRLEAL